MSDSGSPQRKSSKVGGFLFGLPEKAKLGSSRKSFKSPNSPSRKTTGSSSGSGSPHNGKGACGDRSNAPAPPLRYSPAGPKSPPSRGSTGKSSTLVVQEMERKQRSASFTPASFSPSSPSSPSPSSSSVSTGHPSASVKKRHWSSNTRVGAISDSHVISHSHVRKSGSEDNLSRSALPTSAPPSRPMSHTTTTNSNINNNNVNNNSNNNNNNNINNDKNNSSSSSSNNSHNKSTSNAESPSRIVSSRSATSPPVLHLPILPPYNNASGPAPPLPKSSESPLPRLPTSTSPRGMSTSNSTGSISSLAGGGSSARSFTLNTSRMANVDQKAFIEACSSNDVRTLKTLLSRRGALTDFPVDVLHKRPLHVAVSSGSIDVVRVLLKAGAGVRCVDRNGAIVVPTKGHYRRLWHSCVRDAFAPGRSSRLSAHRVDVVERRS
eukprot:TRINITY_DN1189_c0_g1_i1.p1 TRINITY_DN1189_c0_g1~~TRINITY_DN1189_c0_g1_i1.p1  ORF type:complete len:436 (+),score=100.36 TRINITY_DN1189_c0_g1_i1:392-1699(+)